MLVDASKVANSVQVPKTLPRRFKLENDTIRVGPGRRMCDRAFLMALRIGT